MDNWLLPFKADFSRPKISYDSRAVMLTPPGDHLAHTIQISCYDGDSPVDVTAYTAAGHFRRKDGNVVLVEDTVSVSANIVTLVLPQECYAYSGTMHGIVRLTDAQTGGKVTILDMWFIVPESVDGGTIDPGEVIPSIDDLLAEIEAMEEATAAAEAAATLLAPSVDAIEADLYQTADKNLLNKFVFRWRYATNGGVGSTVDMTGDYSAQAGSVVDNCKSGDKYIITGQGGSTPRLWCFVDSDNKIKSVASANTTATNLEITAPDDGKLIFQALFAYPFAITKKNVTELKTDVRFTEQDETLFPYTGFDMFRTIAGLGDSYTEGDLVSSGGDWTTINGISYIGSIARRNGVTANNYSSGGATTKTYLETTAFSNCLNVDPSDLYMICFGINDASGSMTVGTESDIHDADYTQNPDTFCGNYGRIMAQLMAHAPDAKYILIMPWPTGSDYSAYNAAVAQIAAHYGVPCINPSDDPFFTSYFWQAYKSSGHPVAMTYAGMGRAVERLFARCVMENPTYFKYALIG